MPTFTYLCSNCSCHDSRIAGIDDHTAVCVQCGGLMFRMEQDEEVFKHYFLPVKKEIDRGPTGLAPHRQESL